MPESFLLRLMPDALARARIVGRVEQVGSGTEMPVRSAQELIDLLLSFGAGASGDPRPEHHLNVVATVKEREDKTDLADSDPAVERGSDS
jgi:hypothetical protein